MSVNVVARPTAQGAAEYLADAPPFEDAPISPLDTTTEAPIQDTEGDLDPAQLTVRAIEEVVKDARARAKDLTAIEANVSKRGIKIEVPAPMKKQPSWVSPIASSVVHAVVARGLRDDSDESITDFIDTQQHGKPRVFRAWAMRAKELIPSIKEVLKPRQDFEEIRVTESLVYLDESGKESASIMSAALVDEQINGDGTPGPIERTVLAFFRTHRRDLSGKTFRHERAQIPKHFEVEVQVGDRMVPVRKKDISEHLLNMRALTLAEDGKTIKCNTMRPDIAQVEYQKGDKGAEGAGEALAYVLRSNVGFSLTKLAELDVPVTLTDALTGETSHIDIDGLTAVHWAATYMKYDKLALRLIDLKLETLNSGNGNGQSGKHAQDVAKSTTSLKQWFETAEREYWLVHPRIEDPNAESAEEGGTNDDDRANLNEPIAWNDIRTAVSPEVLRCDFDITQAGEGLEPGADPELKYKTKPDIFYTGSPEKVTLELLVVPLRILGALMKSWEHEVRNQIVTQLTGVFVTRALVELKQSAARENVEAR